MHFGSFQFCMKKKKDFKNFVAGSSINMMKVKLKIENKTNSTEMEIEKYKSDLFMLADFIPQ